MVVISPMMEEGRSNRSGYASGFEEAAVRNRFIRKVYTILTAQLTLTTLIVAAFVFIDEVKIYVRAHPGVHYLAMGIFFVTYVLLVCPCCEGIRRSWPTNFIILFIFTLTLSFLTGVTATMYAPYSVFAALAGTVVIVFGLTIFAIQTKYDFTSCAGVICMLSIFFVAFSLIAAIIMAVTGYSRLLDIVYSGLGCLLMMIYIVFHTQLIVGGKNRQMELSPEEYIFATIMLYLDIVQLFIFLLRLFGDRDQ